jgi:hypothetical protein
MAMIATIVSENISQRAAFTVFEQLASRLSQRLPSTLILNPVIRNSKEIAPYIHQVATAVDRFKDENIIMTSWFEPPWAAEQAQIIDRILVKQPKPWIRLGYGTKHKNDIFFDFWAVCFEKLCPQYTTEDLLPYSEPSKLYLNQNRSPAIHKQQLFDGLTDNGYLDFGFVSYGDRGIEETLDNYRQELSLGLPSVSPNDPYTLGSMEIWKNHVLTIVSDSMPPEPKKYGNIVLSEKFYKPIVGLRPFLVNGNPDNVRFLKLQGFDLFEDVFAFNVDNYDQHQVILTTVGKLTALTASQRYDWYMQLLPRLQANLAHFQKYVAQQYEIIDTVVVVR